MKKILFVSSSLGLGGLEKQISYLMKHLYSSGEFELKLFLRNDDLEFPDIKNYCSVVTPKSPAPIQTFLSLFKVIKDFKPDVIHTWENLLTFFSVPGAKIFNSYLINGQIRNSRKRKFIDKIFIITKLNMMFSKRVVSNTYAGLTSFGVRESEKNLVIHNGIDLNEFDHKKLNGNSAIDCDGKIIIGKVANFHRSKDYPTIIRAGIKLLEKRDDLIFVFIGDGPEYARTKSLVPQKFSHNFVFLGKRNDAEAWIKVFDVCLLLRGKSYCEGLSNSIMEYMAASKPVIATNDGGTPELIEDGVNGFLISQEDDESLVSKLNYLIVNEERRIIMGKINREKVNKNFSVSQMIDKYLKLYQSL